MANSISKQVIPNDSAALARALIGTKHKPAGLSAIIANAAQARAYHEMQPYPKYAFRNWKTEDLGPLPRCLAICKRIVRRGARFLFGKGIEIACPQNPKLEEVLRAAWKDNHMPARAVAMAEDAAIDSGVALKFSWDPDCKPNICIDVLSIIDQVRFYYHPHNRRKVLMARIQYRYHDPVTGKWLWYREEWTAEEQIIYIPVQEDKLGVGKDADSYDQWLIMTRERNPFGLIPIVQVRNMETGSQFGSGDCWGLYRLVDDLNLVYFQMKRSNQFDSELNPIFIDLSVDDDDVDKPLAPGQPVDLKSVEDKDGKVMFPPGGNSLRPALMEYAKDVRRQIEDASGATSVNQDEFTNKGNLTKAVLEQLYQVQIETNDEKKKSYGQNGIEPFLEALALGLQRIGLDLGVNEKNDDTFNVEVTFADNFEPTEEERTALVGRMQEEENAGYITRARAVKKVAQMEGYRDIAALEEELAEEAKPSPTEDDFDMVDTPGASRDPRANQDNRRVGFRQ